VSITLDDAAISALTTKVAAAAAGLVLLVALLAAGRGGTASLFGGGETAPSATATASIPPAMLALYHQAATTCPGLPWMVLAAVGTGEIPVSPGVRRPHALACCDHLGLPGLSKGGPERPASALSTDAQDGRRRSMG